MLLLILLSVLVSVRGETSPVTQCQNNAGEMPINTYVSGCTRMPCELPSNETASINLIFKAPRTVRSMRTLASASVVVFNIVLPAIRYPLGEAEVTCNYITNSYCPLMEGEVVQYTLNMFIEEFFPVWFFDKGVMHEILSTHMLSIMFQNTVAIVEFYAVDENDLPVFCLQMTINIVPNPNQRDIL